MSDDRVATYLAEVRERATHYARPVLPATSRDAVRATINSAEDVPRLLAAVEAALALMRDPDGVYLPDWDVSASPIHEAISAALLGEESPR